MLDSTNWYRRNNIWTLVENTVWDSVFGKPCVDLNERLVPGYWVVSFLDSLLIVEVDDSTKQQYRFIGDENSYDVDSGNCVFLRSITLDKQCSGFIL